MKILYVSTISGTINAFLAPHIEMLLDLGHQVDIACKISSPISKTLLDRGCRVFEMEFQRSPFKKDNIKAYNALKNLVIDEKYDLVHTHTPVASVITRLVCKNIKGTKVFYTAHGFHFYKGAPLINWLTYYPIEKWLSKYTDCLITINKEDYNTSINKKFKAKEIKLVHGVGVDLSKFEPQTIEKNVQMRKEYTYNEDDFILFYAAELNGNKHQDLLINTVNNLKNKIPNIKLLLAGRGPLEDQYKRQVKELGIEDKIEFLGFRNDINNLLMLSDIAVASSRREGLPVNVMEAMATGLPLVITDIRGHRDLVIDGENGYIVGVDDVEGFANAIEELWSSKNLRNEFGKKSTELVEQYSIENVLEEMSEIYSTYL